MNRVEKFFDRYAYDFDAIYGTSQSLLNRLLNPILRKSMRTRFEKTLLYSEPIKGLTALDIGCGPGHYSIAFAENGAANVVGLDFSEEMIKIASKRVASLELADRCRFIVEDIFTYAASEKFDFSVVMGVMDYIADPQKMIAKVLDLTTKKAYFSFPCSGGFLALQRRVRYLNRCPLYMYSRKQLKTLFDTFLPNEYTIEKISRDYFVTVNINKQA